MIGLYLRPDKTQLVKGKLKKDKTLSISVATETQPYWDALTDQSGEFKEDEILDLSNLFREINTMVSTSYEEFHIVLPDSLFYMIDSAEFLTDEDFMYSVREKTGKEDEEVYYSFPITTAPGGQQKRTFFAIDRDVVNRLIEAAQKENITLASIEPASIAFLRSCTRWQEEHFLIEIFNEQATMVSYSPAGGIFSLNAPNLGVNQLRRDTETANQEIRSMFAIHDYTAEKVFSSMNVNVPFTILTEDRTILELDAFKERPSAAEFLPTFVAADIDPEYQQEWMIPTGTLLQNQEIEDELYTTLPPFMQIASANVLPEKIQMGAKFKQWKQLAKKYSRILILFLAVLSFFEVAGILYFSSITISKQLQTDYDSAQKDIQDIDAEIKILAAAKKEHEYPMEAFTKLMDNRPNNCGFSSVSIGNNGQVKSNDEKWIRLMAVSTDPIVFQSYAATLSNDEMFTNVNLNKIDTDSSSGFKTAEITIGKGKVQ